MTLRVAVWARTVTSLACGFVHLADVHVVRRSRAVDRTHQVEVASLAHACGVLRREFAEAVRVLVVKDLMMIAGVDGDSIHGEATLCNVVRRELGVPLSAVTGPSGEPGTSVPR